MDKQAAMDLGGRVALVTGARTGIGRAVALALAHAGAQVVVHGHGGDMGSVVEPLAAMGALAGTVSFDIREVESARHAVQALMAQHAIDILVNNAGLTHRAAAWDYPLDQWQAVVAGNLTTPFALAQLVAGAMMARRRGKIVNIASLQSFQGGTRIVAYAAAKHGVAGLTRSLAVELAPYNVQVNAVAPGYIETAMTEPLRQDPERRRDILARIPAGRWGRPEDVAGAVVFLASALSDYITGQVLAVDGGWMAR